MIVCLWKKHLTKGQLMSDDKRVPPIKIGPKQLEDLLEDFAEFQRKMNQLRRGEDPFKDDKEKKAEGGSVGSLMEKGRVDQEYFPSQYNNLLARMYQVSVDSKKPKIKLAQGSSPIDDEILELEMFVGLRPLNALEAGYIEEMKERLNYLYELKMKDKK